MVVGNLKKVNLSSYPFIRVQLLDMRPVNKWHVLFDLEDSGYFYTRLANPTNDAVAKKIAALEGGVGAVLTSSGQAANFYAIINICGAGDHLVTSNTIYGGTYNLFGVTLKKLGIEVYLHRSRVGR